MADVTVGIFIQIHTVISQVICKLDPHPQFILESTPLKYPPFPIFPLHQIVVHIEQVFPFPETSVVVVPVSLK
jgi:hypothetical protein